MDQNRPFFWRILIVVAETIAKSIEKGTVKHRGVIRWSKRFLLELLAELRDLICGDSSKKSKRRSKKLPGKESYGYFVATSIAAYIMELLHVSNAVALGLATLILIRIGQSTRNAFCKMTDREILEAMLDPNNP
jgi:hypothetical protein